MKTGLAIIIAAAIIGACIVYAATQTRYLLISSNNNDIRAFRLDRFTGKTWIITTMGQEYQTQTTSIPASERFQ